MIIKTIQIKNYKSICDSGELKITKLFALIGKNNTGKSAIVDAIQVFWGTKGKELKPSDFHKGSSEIEITVSVGPNDGTEGSSKAKDQTKLVFKATPQNLKGEYSNGKSKVTPKRETLPFPNF